MNAKVSYYQYTCVYVSTVLALTVFLAILGALHVQ